MAEEERDQKAQGEEPRTEAKPDGEADDGTSRKRQQLELAGEIKRQKTRDDILSASPLKTGRITGSVFALAAMSIIAISGLTGHMSFAKAMQTGVFAMAVFFGIGFLIGHIGHQLVSEYTDRTIAEEDATMLGPLPMPGDDLDLPKTKEADPATGAKEGEEKQAGAPGETAA